MVRGKLAILLLLFLMAFSSSTWAGEAFWIDVRSADEYASGHVEGASNIPYTEITARIAEVTGDKDDLIYVYCRSGRRSGIAKQALMEAGYTNVINLGGLEDARKKAAADASP